MVAVSSTPPPAPAPRVARCPADMVYVEHDYCPRMQRRCVDSEYSKANHITICHEFAVGEQECLEPRERREFCIDRYEYPNEAGGHPPVMIDWYEAMGLCAARGRRLCYESEWVAACEGPDETPFPYGWQRSSEQCNIDNPWINPSLTRAYSRDPAVRAPELERLDQSVPSGAKPGCVSGYGVYDLTGNFDEWAMADRDRPQTKADFAALKGGAWGHVRNACRPVTTSHNPSFRYYFITARCCRDPLPPQP
jgi:sulfatase modifying factor 1